METFSNQAGNEKKPVFIGLRIRMSVYRRVREGREGGGRGKKNKQLFTTNTNTFLCPQKKPTGKLFSVDVKYSKFEEGSVIHD